jgi:hypothetical protein
MKTCIACGMPMETPADHALGDESKEYCVYCARPDGTMESYEEKLDGMTNFIVRTQGLDAAVARSTARAMMAQLPAWKDRTA